MSLRRSDRERRSAIPNDYIIFLQEHEDDICLTEDDDIVQEQDNDEVLPQIPIQ